MTRRVTKRMFRAVVQRDGEWWIGWIEKIPGVNAQARTRQGVYRDLQTALDEYRDFFSTEDDKWRKLKQ